MFLIDCFQNICNKLGVPLSEETTEGLVNYFNARKWVCVWSQSLSYINLCGLPENTWLLTCVYVVYISSWHHKISRIGMEILQTFNFIQTVQEQWLCNLGTSSYFCWPLEWKLDIREVITFLDFVLFWKQTESP